MAPHDGGSKIVYHAWYGSMGARAREIVTAVNAHTINAHTQRNSRFVARKILLQRRVRDACHRYNIGKHTVPCACRVADRQSSLADLNDSAHAQMCSWKG